MEKRRNTNWKYLVLLACFLTTMFSSAIFNCFGVFVLPWMAEFSGPAGAVAIITSCGSGFSGIACPLGSMISQKWGYQKVHILAGVLLMTSFVASAFAESLSWLFFTFSMLGGMGTALASVAFANAINDHFKTHLGVACVITSIGYGVGNFLFPFLFQHLIDEYTWRGAMFVTGAIMGNVIVCGYVNFPLPQAPPLPLPNFRFWCKEKRTAKGNENSSHNGEHSASEVPPVQEKNREKMEIQEKKIATLGFLGISKVIFTSSTFYLLVIQNILGHAGHFIAIGLTPLRAYYDLGLTEQQTMTLLSTMGITQLVFRLLLVIIVHFKWVRIFTLYLCLNIAVSLATLLSLLARSYATQLLYCIAVGTGFSGNAFYIMIVPKLFGKAYSNVAYGYLEISHGAGILLGPYIGGTIFDITGSSQYSFLFAGLSTFVGFLILIVGLVVTGKRNKMAF